MKIQKQFANGNVIKAESYAAAWHQIDESIKNGYYIEAISIQESIVSDRLLQHLHRYHELPLRKKRNQHHTLYSLISEIQKNYLDSDAKELFAGLNSWRNNRNEAIHSLVRSDPGTPTTPVSEFFKKAKDVAEQGANMAKDVQNWCRREATRIKKLKKS